MLSTTQLASLYGLPSPLLTAYVRTSPDDASLQGGTPKYVHFLKEEGRSLSEGLASEERDQFCKQLERVREFFSQPKSHGSLVIFAGPSVWQVLPLQAEIEHEMSWGTPNLAQLVWLFGEHKRYGIVAIDHKRARFFHYSLGEIVENQEKKLAVDTSEWKQKDLGKVSAEGMSITHGTQRDVFDKRVENQYVRFCREIARQATALFADNDLAAIFLLGPDKLIQTAESKFPRSFQPPIVRVDQDLAHLEANEMRTHLQPHMAAWERQHQAALVSAAAEGKRGTIRGFEEVLVQLQRGMVRTVLLGRDFNPALQQCRECGWKGTCRDRVCPACHGEAANVTLRHVLPEMLLKHAVELEIVSGEPAERLKQMGGMAGWLRQKKVTAKAGA
jgi:peptide subunit release factor 1 (eRF1)